MPLHGSALGFMILVVLVDVVGLAVGGLLLWADSVSRARWRDLWIPVIVALVAYVCGEEAGRLLTGSPFVGIRLACHALFCVFAPLLMARGLWLLHHRAYVGALLLVLGAGMDLTYLWAREVEPFNLQVRRYDVMSSAYQGPPLKIAIVSDLQTDHVGRYEERVFDQVDHEGPDLLLLPGDFLQVMNREAYARERPRLQALFQRLHPFPRLGAFAVWGNVDAYPDLLDGSPVESLEGKAKTWREVPELQLVGLPPSADRALPPWVSDAARAFDGLTIVMSHQPDVAAETIERGVDGDAGRLLIVSGHTHGGQIVVPWLGPPATLSSLPRRFAGGFHPLPSRRATDATEAGGWVVVSRGVGCERELAPRIRLFCPPELVILTLRARDRAGR